MTGPLPGGAAKTFWPAARRLLGLLHPFRWRMLGAVAATCCFAGLNVAAPNYLGDATDIVVDGVYSGVFEQERLGILLAVVSLMYVGASVFNWVQGKLTAGSVQGLMHSLRAQGKVEAAEAVQNEFEAAWSKATVSLRIEDLN